MRKNILTLLLFSLVFFSCVEPQPEKKSDIALQTAQQYHQEGKKLMSQGKLDEAMDKFQESLKISTTSAYKAGRAMNLEMIGFMHMLKNEPDKAMDALVRALSLYEELDENRNIAGLLNTIGKIYVDRGNYDRAIEFYNRSLKVDQEHKNHTGVGVTLNNIGRIFYERKKYGYALKYYNQALDIFVMVGDSKRSRVVLQNIRLVEEQVKKNLKK